MMANVSPMRNLINDVQKTKLGCALLYVLLAHYYVKWDFEVRCQILGCDPQANSFYED